MSSLSPSTAAARALVTELVRHGVSHVVLAPGSRNAPLAFAVADAAEAGVLRLHTRIDERTAGFLALGLSKQLAGRGERAAVICTSGTAAANLHPAMLEAAHAAVPLVAVTADRPARLRGTSANQTTDQVGLFGAAVRAADLPADLPADLAARVEPFLVRRDGPVHLNAQYDDPLVPSDRWTPDPIERTEPASRPVTDSRSVPIGPRTVVVAGDDAGPRARQLAERAGWPLIAEPSSGSRTGDAALRCGRLLLDGELGAEVERVVVLGHPTLSRPVSRLLGRADVEVWARREVGVWSERPFAVAETFDHLERPETASVDDVAWRDRWREADRRVGRQLDRLLAGQPRLTPYAVAGAVHRALPEGGLLWVGASSPIRDLDLMARPTGVGEHRKILANRGLAGIDGTISSALGAAIARDRSSRVLALMGDVTFLHDQNGLVLGPQEERPDMTVVVVNDDGGAIFAMLEQGAPEHADRFERLFATPHGVDVASLCAATRTPHLRVTSLPELEQALASPNGGIEVIEAVVGRADRRALDAEIRGLAADDR